MTLGAKKQRPLYFKTAERRCNPQKSSRSLLLSCNEIQRWLRCLHPKGTNDHCIFHVVWDHLIECLNDDSVGWCNCSMTLPRGQLPSLSIQRKVRDHIVQKLGPFPRDHGEAPTVNTASSSQAVLLPTVPPDATSLSQVLADPSFYLTDTYKPKTFGTTAKQRRENASSAPASLDSLSNADVGMSASASSVAGGGEVSHADELVSRLLDTSAAEQRMKQASRKAKRDWLVETKLMASSALQRYPRSVISFWDKYAQKSLPADALTKGQAKRLALTMKADGELDANVNVRHPKAGDFHRAPARADWLKEPWLLLDVPPHSVSALDSVHNVMGSVYSVGVTRQGVDELVDQYAKRCASFRGFSESAILLFVEHLS
jgi:hypothetical protein